MCLAGSMVKAADDVLREERLDVGVGPVAGRYIGEVLCGWGVLREAEAFCHHPAELPSGSVLVGGKQGWADADAAHHPSTGKVLHRYIGKVVGRHVVEAGAG